MMFDEIQIFLKEQKIKLLKATEFIISFYKQIHSSVITLRDTLFKHAFRSDPEWKKLLNPDIRELTFKEFQLLSTDGQIQNNSDYIVNVANNIQAILNDHLLRLESFKMADIEQIKGVNKYCWEFVKNIYSDDNTGLLTGQRLEFANAIKRTVQERLENNIAPFFNYLELILTDEYRVKLIPVLKKVVGHYKNYMASPLKYDRTIKQTCAEMGFEYYQDLILSIIADLTKTPDALITEIKAKYAGEDQGEGTPKKHIFRLKEIASRFVAQLGNLTKLEQFITLVHEIFQPVSFLSRILNLLKKLFTGKPPQTSDKDFIFHFSTRSGKLESKETSVKSLLKNITSLKNFITKFKNTMDFYTLTKTSGSTAASKEIENIIDNCITELSDIHDKCIGLREWIIAKKNQKNLSRLPEAKQEEFNSILLAINYNLIINKQHIRDLELAKKK